MRGGVKGTQKREQRPQAEGEKYWLVRPYSEKNVVRFAILPAEKKKKESRRQRKKGEIGRRRDAGVRVAGAIRGGLSLSCREIRQVENGGRDLTSSRKEGLLCGRRGSWARGGGENICKGATTHIRGTEKRGNLQHKGYVSSLG